MVPPKEMTTELAKILIVDNDPLGRVLLREYLADIPSEVVESGSGEEALALCACGNDFAVALLDVRMPGMSGYELAERIQRIQPAPNIPILFITAFETKSVQVLEGYRAGAVDFIQKPVDERILVAKVSVFLELHQRRRELERYAQLLEDRQASLEREIVERQRLEKKLRYQADYDSLTGLPKRTLFQDRLGQAMIMAGRRGEAVVLMLINLDRFKMVNDTLGHEGGNALLRETALRIASCVRHTDTLARLEGDEFTILLLDITHAAYVELVARKIQEQMARPFLIGREEVRASCSIGIANFPVDAQGMDELVKNADAALFRAKEAGRSTFRFFSPETDALVQERTALGMDLRHALQRGEFLLHYQPLVDLRTGEVEGAEALLRWRHPERGLIPPALFIPMAEETGLIQDIGRWVVRTACAQAVVWNGAHPSPLHMAVNFSLHQCGDCLDFLSQVLNESGLSPEHLVLEITESVLLKDVEKTIATLGQVRQLGVGLFLDDFGTGYSSLSYLQRLPLNVVKIDRSFVRDMTTDASARSITEAIIAMAHSLGLTVIAEGVETPQQLDMLKERQCDKGQGFLFAKPLDPQGFEQVLKKGSLPGFKRGLPLGAVTSPRPPQ